MVRKGKHSGLLLLTEDNKAVILQANKSYSAHINKNLKYNKHIPFVEKLSIPRGRQDAGEADYETAVREFIEETGLIFDMIYVYREPFYLEWQDDAKLYRYNMFVAFLKGPLNCLHKRPNSYNIRLRRTPNDDDTNIYDVDLYKQRHYSKELMRRIELMSLQKYMVYMENRQLPTYKYSNYEWFFKFVCEVKHKYNDARYNDDFFAIFFYYDTKCVKEYRDEFF